MLKKEEIFSPCLTSICGTKLQNHSKCLMDVDSFGSHVAPMRFQINGCTLARGSFCGLERLHRLKMNNSLSFYCLL